MSLRTGFLSRCCRFGMGIGMLSVSRGYGPVPSELDEAPTKLGEGAPGPRMRSQAVEAPTLVSVRRTTKNEAKEDEAA